MRDSYSQGFVNLNFEAANTTGYPTFGSVPAATAIPSWAAYTFDQFGTITQSQIVYNAISTGGALVGLVDTNGSLHPTPLQGRYSVLLEASQGGTPTTAAIGQTGQVPLSALSLLFYTSLDSTIQVAFNGQPIALVQTGATANYAIMAGNISAFAGLTGQLLFSASPNYGYGLIDNIQFSSSPVPEPNVLALSALAGLLLRLRSRKKPKL